MPCRIWTLTVANLICRNISRLRLFVISQHSPVLYFCILVCQLARQSLPHFPIRTFYLFGSTSFFRRIVDEFITLVRSWSKIVFLSVLCVRFVSVLVKSNLGNLLPLVEVRLAPLVSLILLRGGILCLV